jgi:RNA polymerase sigma factor (sigma-70 family)
VVGCEDGAAALTILEFYRDHRQEIEVLEDSKALFVLTFIAEIGNTNLADLGANIGWSTEETSAIIEKLNEAQLLRDTSDFSAENPIRIAPRGLSMMTTLHFPRNKEKRIDDVIDLVWSDAIPSLGWRAFAESRGSSVFNAPPKVAYVQEEAIDLDLLNAARGGDRQAGEKLYEKYREFVLAATRLYFRNEADAEDALQRTFIRLLTGPPRTPQRPIKSLIRFTARNIAWDMQKEGFRRFEAPLAEAEKQEKKEIFSHWQREEELAITRSVYAELLARVGALIEAEQVLPLHDRELAYRSLYRAVVNLRPDERLFWLYYLEGLTLHEVAQELQIPESYARVRLQRTIDKLRYSLKKALDESKRKPSE